MEEKRRDRIGAGGAGAQHLEEITVALSSDLNEPVVIALPRQERRAVGFAYTVGEDGVPVRNRGGSALLLSSALAKDHQTGGNMRERVAEALEGMIRNHPNYAMFTRAMAESGAMLNPQDEDAAQGAGFLSQRSNIDPLWLTFYIAFKVLSLSVADFYKWQSAIYTTCRTIRGKNNLRAVLSTFQQYPGVGLTINSMSNSSEIYSPPWVLHWSRLYDIAACIGPCDSKKPDLTISKPAVSWRYFFTVNPARRGVIKFIVTLNAIEKIADPAGDVLQSEKILHQYILGRISPLANTNEVTGNALSVRFVGN